MKKSILFYLLVPLFFLSCSAKNNYYMSIDSIVPNDNISFEKTYTLKLIGADIEDLYFKEYSLYIKYALSKKGYIYKEDGNANLIIFVDYGNGNPKISYQTITTVNQTLAISETNTYVKYSNYIYLCACDKYKYENNKKMDFLWQTSLCYVNDTGDLREQFPIMMNIALPYIGEDTYKCIVINKEMSKEDNKRFVSNSSRKELKYVEVKDFLDFDKIKKYQELSKDFFENNKKYLKENVIDDKYKEYYTNNKNYEYFSDIDSLIATLKQKVTTNSKNNKPVSKTDSEKRQKEYDSKNISKVKILEDYILQQIEQGVPVAK